MLFHRSRSLVVLAAASTLACSGPGLTCNPNLPVSPRAISITVLDSATGHAMADSASGVVAWDQASDTLWHDYSYPDSLLFGGSRAATYAVAIVRQGYQQWLRGGIVVASSGSCGNYVPVAITARLQPAP